MSSGTPKAGHVNFPQDVATGRNGQLSPTDYRGSTYTSNSSTLYSSTASPTPSRFADSVHLIEPTNPRPPKRYEPLILNLFVVIGSPLLMFMMGIGLVVAAGLSNRLGGFELPGSSFSTVFGDLSAQFLASILPTIFILPNAILWRELDWTLRSYQPFITLQKGGAKAEESLLLDYVEYGPLLSLPRALKYKHRIIFVSSLTAVFTYFLQPLTGAILQIRQTPQTSTWIARRTETIGLSPDIPSLQAFIAAAGYADASVFHNFSHAPEFINGGWATGKFMFPTNPMLNATLTLKTNGIKTNANCSTPISGPSITREGQNVTLTSTSINNCVHIVSFNPGLLPVSYGVEAVTCPGQDPELSVALRPVMFWFFRERLGNANGEARSVFCAPILSSSNVEVEAIVSTGRISRVTGVGDNLVPNDVLNGDFAGKAFNGVVFSPNPNPFVEARGAATNLLVPSTILLRMTQQGLDATFASANRVMDATSEVYTKHLTLAAKSIYFVPAELDIPAKLVAIMPRLWVDPIPAHILAAILVLTGIAGVFLHVMNRRQRKKLHLASYPGSIAATVSLTSHSGWAELLTPYDNEVMMEKKLEGLRFTLDKRTGAIVADDYGIEMPVPDHDTNDMTLSLMGKRGSSSEEAFQAAAGLAPWKDTGHRKSIWETFRLDS